MLVRITQPSWIKSLSGGKKYIEDISTRASDLRPFFNDIKDDISKSIQAEFDYSNPNKWEPISKAWREQKAIEGKPENIGIYRGDLMRAASTEAIIFSTPLSLTWEIAPVDSIDFTRRRKIGITTRKAIRGLGRKIIKVIMGQG